MPAILLTPLLAIQVQPGREALVVEKLASPPQQIGAVVAVSRPPLSTILLVKSPQEATLPHKHTGPPPAASPLSVEQDIPLKAQVLCTIPIGRSSQKLILEQTVVLSPSRIVV